MTETLKHETLVEAVCSATKQVFSTMIGLDLAAGEAYLDQNAPGPSAGVVSLIGLAGQWAGTGSLSCSSDFACRISSQLLMSECPAVDEEVLDAVAEVTNMVIGNIKTALEEDLGSMGLSIPTVIFGRNFTTRSVGKNDWTVVPFYCGQERLEVQVCLAPNRDAPRAVRHGFMNPAAVNLTDGPAGKDGSCHPA